jgi:hypothetical protein
MLKAISPESKLRKVEYFDKGDWVPTFELAIDDREIFQHNTILESSDVQVVHSARPQCIQERSRRIRTVAQVIRAERPLPHHCTVIH